MSASGDLRKQRRVNLTKKIFAEIGPTEGCMMCDYRQCHLYRGDHSNACRARVEALMAADPELRKMLESAQTRKEEYMAKLAEAGAEPCRRDRRAGLSEEPRAPSPPDATAAAGSSAYPAQGEARGFFVDAKKTKRGDHFALRLRFVKFDHQVRVCVNSLHMGCRQIFQEHATLPWGSIWCLSHCERKT